VSVYKFPRVVIDPKIPLTLALSRKGRWNYNPPPL